MKRFLFLFLFLVGNSSCRAAPAQALDAAVESTAASNIAYDPASFLSELQRIADILKKNPSGQELAALRDSLPKEWTVATPEGSYAISSRPFENQLASNSPQKALAWVDNLAAQIEDFNSPSGAVPAAARTELNRILARPEFGAVRPPNSWDRFKQRVAAWLERQLLKLFGGIDKYPITGKIVFWVLIFAGVTFVALWIFRFLARRDNMQALPPSDIIAASRTWQEWIRLAREAADRGDFREAVHSTYWAGIVHLESAGVVPNDRTKTPREYLRIVADLRPHEFSARPAFREPLTSLTSRLERIWYANRAATSDDYRESLRQLEALGCPLE